MYGGRRSTRAARSQNKIITTGSRTTRGARKLLRSNTPGGSSSSGGGGGATHFDNHRNQGARHTNNQGYVRNYALVQRRPAPHIDFLVTKWVPVTELTDVEREEYDREKNRKESTTTLQDAVIAETTPTVAATTTTDVTDDNSKNNADSDNATNVETPIHLSQPTSAAFETTSVDRIVVGTLSTTDAAAVSFYNTLPVASSAPTLASNTQHGPTTTDLVADPLGDFPSLNAPYEQDMDRSTDFAASAMAVEGIASTTFSFSTALETLATEAAATEAATTTGSHPIYNYWMDPNKEGPTDLVAEPKGDVAVANVALQENMDRSFDFAASEILVAAETSSLSATDIVLTKGPTIFSFSTELETLATEAAAAATTNSHPINADRMDVDEEAPVGDPAETPMVPATKRPRLEY
jgi:hypothetical protein